MSTSAKHGRLFHPRSLRRRDETLGLSPRREDAGTLIYDAYLSRGARINALVVVARRIVDFAPRSIIAFMRSFQFIEKLFKELDRSLDEVDYREFRLEIKTRRYSPWNTRGEEANRKGGRTRGS